MSYNQQQYEALCKIAEELAKKASEAFWNEVRANRPEINDLDLYDDVVQELESAMSDSIEEVVDRFAPDPYIDRYVANIPTNPRSRSRVKNQCMQLIKDGGDCRNIRVDCDRCPFGSLDDDDDYCSQCSAIRRAKAILYHIEFDAQMDEMLTAEKPKPPKQRRKKK